MLDFLLGSISPSVNLRDCPACSVFNGAGVVLVRRKVWARRFALEPFGSRDCQKSLETDMLAADYIARTTGRGRVAMGTIEVDKGDNRRKRKRMAESK